MFSKDEVRQIDNTISALRILRDKKVLTDSETKNVELHLKRIEQWNERILGCMADYDKKINAATLDDITPEHKQFVKKLHTLIARLGSTVTLRYLEESIILLRIYCDAPTTSTPNDIAYIESFPNKMNDAQYLDVIKKAHDGHRFDLLAAYAGIAICLGLGVALMTLAVTGSGLGLIAPASIFLYAALSLTMVTFIVLFPTSWQALISVYSQLGLEPTEVSKSWCFASAPSKPSAMLFSLFTKPKTESIALTSNPSDIINGLSAKIDTKQDESSETKQDEPPDPLAIDL